MGVALAGLLFAISEILSAGAGNVPIAMMQLAAVMVCIMHSHATSCANSGNKAAEG